MAQEEESTNKNIFVKFLPSEVNDDILYDLFSQFGTILSVKVMIDNYTGSSLGFGFVRFEQQEQATMAIEKMNGHRMGSKTFLCKLAKQFIFPNPSLNLYVKPLPLGYTEGELRDLFGKFGQIQAVKIVDDVGIATSVIGFVKYCDIKSATQAIQEFNNSKMFPNLPNLLVKYAESDIQRVTRKATTHPPHKTKEINQAKEIKSPYPPPSSNLLSSSSSLSSSLSPSISPYSTPAFFYPISYLEYGATFAMYVPQNHYMIISHSPHALRALCLFSALSILL